MPSFGTLPPDLWDVIRLHQNSVQFEVSVYKWTVLEKISLYCEEQIQKHPVLNVKKENYLKGFLYSLDCLQF